MKIDILKQILVMWQNSHNEFNNCQIQIEEVQAMIEEEAEL